MVSRQETARPLLTPGEVMQLAPEEALVLVSGTPPIRARKLKYFTDRNFTARILAAPNLTRTGAYPDCPTTRMNDWTGRVAPIPDGIETEHVAGGIDDGGHSRHPTLELPDQGGALLDDVAVHLLDEDSDNDSGTATGALDALARDAARRAFSVDHGGDDFLPDF
jgi:type IV secretion system protein VirD4